MDKQRVIEVLKQIHYPFHLIQENLVKEIIIRDKEIKILLAIKNPAFHIKKKLEDNILTLFSKQEEFNTFIISIDFFIETKKNSYDPKIPGIKNIIAIASGKGGVGKSTLAANIAICLSQIGFEVGLLDADIYGPSSTILFDIENQQPKGKKINGEKKIEPILSHHIKVLSMGLFAEANQAIVWRGPMASKALRQLLRDAYWGDLDFLIIDLPPGTGDIHLSLVQEIPLTGALIIGTPQKIAIADLRKSLAMFKLDSINVPVLGLVENMAFFSPEELPENKYYIFGKEGVKTLAKDLNIAFLGQIPLIQSIQEDADQGDLTCLKKQSPIRKFFLDITKNMIGELLKRNTELPPTEVVRIHTMTGCSS